MAKRIQESLVIKDLEKKIVLLVGPRQTGKTWLAREIAEKFTHSVYLNYDQVSDRKIIVNQSWLDNTELVILDELHKMPDWKNYLKGLFDTKNEKLKILVTGSARLDIFDQLGDSLAGRYYRHRFLPFSISELGQVGLDCSIDRLIERGGFPEPLLAENKLEADRWRQQYINSMLATDIFEFDRVQNIKAMQLIFQLLRNRVGSPVSYQSIAEDVSVSAVTVKKYIEILESLYIVFKVTPYSSNIARSLIKEPKVYFYDTALVQGDIGKKLENLVANALLKHCYAKSDYCAEDDRLHYLRTKDGIEVNFALVKDGMIQQMIEVKTSNSDVAKALSFFEKKYEIPAVQLVYLLKKEFKKGNIEIRQLEGYLRDLYI